MQHFWLSVAAFLSVLLLAWLMSWLGRMFDVGEDIRAQKREWLYDTSEVLERRED